MCAAHVSWGYFGVFKMSVGCFLVKARTASGFVKESAFYEEKKKAKLLFWHNYHPFGTQSVPCTAAV